MQENKPPTDNDTDNLRFNSKDSLDRYRQDSLTDDVSVRSQKEGGFYNFMTKPKDNFLRSLEVGRGTQPLASATLYLKERDNASEFQSVQNTDHILYKTPNTFDSEVNTKRHCSDTKEFSLDYDPEIIRDEHAGGFPNVNTMYKWNEYSGFNGRRMQEPNTLKNTVSGPIPMMRDLSNRKESASTTEVYFDNSQKYFSLPKDSYYNVDYGNQISKGARNILDRSNYRHASELAFLTQGINEAHVSPLSKSNIRENMFSDGKTATMSKVYNFNMKMLNKNFGPYSASESFMGCVHSEKECRTLIEYAMNGYIGMIRRRINEKEKSSIRPGSIFIFNESESGIKRWTDKKQWSPSRLQGPFLVYKELNGPLYKKTYTLSFPDSVYHLISYSYLQWEEKGECCKIFKKGKDTHGRKEFHVKEDRNPGSKTFSYEKQPSRNTAHCDSSIREQEDSLIDEYRQLVKEANEALLKKESSGRPFVQQESSCPNEGMETLDAYFNVNS